ncbi:hypothetical protein [Agromyces silvae]|uniref:hypothetical protein n=1 Tax=Agromyces silvae TaxID=3388266 RepID=UPI00280AF1D7|nr:hypothetical protein [Agromyces protaetiae]
MNLFDPSMVTSAAEPVAAPRPRESAPVPAARIASTTDASTNAPRAKRGVELGPVRPNRLQRLGGLGLIAAPLLFAGGMLTSPQQTAPGNEGYIASLAADPALSLASANFLHYGWVALAFGAIAALGLVRGRRGRVWMSIASVVLAFGAIQMSGLLLSDWFLVSMGNFLPLESAAAIDAAAKEGSVAIWQYSGMAAGILGIAGLSLGLARAKAISWWVAPLAFLPWILPAVLGGPIGVIAATLCYAPLIVAGVRLVAKR